MQLSNVFLIAFSFFAAVSALPVQSASESRSLARRAGADVSFGSDSAPMFRRSEMDMYEDGSDMFARDFEDTFVDEVIDARDVDEDEYESFSLQRRDDACTICLEAGAKHTNCPNGAAHPAHIECLMKWAQAQADAGHALTCSACRAKISPLIKKVTAKKH